MSCNDVRYCWPRDAVAEFLIPLVLNFFIASPFFLETYQHRWEGVFRLTEVTVNRIDTYIFYGRSHIDQIVSYRIINAHGDILKMAEGERIERSSAFTGLWLATRHIAPLSTFRGAHYLGFNQKRMKGATFPSSFQVWENKLP